MSLSLLNKKTLNIVFLEDTHTYLYNGVKIPSVSDIVKAVGASDYSNIPKNILAEKAGFGTRVHDDISAYEQSGGEILPQSSRDIYERICTEQYIKLKNRFNIDIASSEQIVTFNHKYAGRYDLLGEVDGVPAVMDIKTTAKLHAAALSWQLSLYELAIEDSYNLPQGAIKNLYCIWLPKGEPGRLVEVERINRGELLEVVESLEG